MNRFTEIYQEYAAEFTDTPTVFHEFVSYWLLSSTLQRNVYLVQGHQNVYANLWIVLLAPSSLFHKSYALSIGMEILECVLPGFTYPSEFSHEKLIEILQKQPSGTFVYDEFASLLDHLEREYARGTRALLTSLYGGGVYKRATGVHDERRFEVRDTFLNIAAASTVSWLKKGVKDEALAGGFLPRFLLVPEVERTKLMAFQPPADQGKKNRLVNMLAAFRAVEGEAKYTEDARAAFEKFYGEFIPTAEAKSERIQPFLARLVPYIHKLALILSVDRGEFPRITLAAFTEAKLRISFLARRLEEVLIRDLGATPWQQKAARVADLIKRRNSSGISVSEILRRATISSREWKDIRATLEESEQIEVKPIPSGTKPTTMIFWTGDH